MHCIRGSSPNGDVNSIVTFEIHSSSVTPAAGPMVRQPQSDLVFTTIARASLLHPARGFYGELPGRNGPPVLLGRDGNLP